MTILVMDVRVLVVDDHPGFRRSVRTLLEVEGFEVVGEACDGREALALVDELRPELVLLDVGLPDTSGFDIAERLSRGTSRVILVSSRDPGDFGRRVRRCRALGFVPKDRLTGSAVRDLLAQDAHAGHGDVAG